MFFLTGNKAGFTKFKHNEISYLEDRQSKAIQMVSDCSHELKSLYDDMKNSKEWEK